MVVSTVSLVDGVVVLEFSLGDNVVVSKVSLQDGVGMSNFMLGMAWLCLEEFCYASLDI